MDDLFESQTVRVGACYIACYTVGLVATIALAMAYEPFAIQASNMMDHHAVIMVLGSLIVLPVVGAIVTAGIILAISIVAAGF
jgi:hypothetical protein